ncbi:MAG: efflux RND transporter periplasmic adaptor subunit [Candidatus Saccharibacteria bacterium]
MKRFAVLFLVLVVLLTSLPGCGSESANTGIKEEKLVKTAVVASGKAASSSILSGVLAPLEETAVGFEVNGRILALNVKEGDSVAAGQVIGRVDAAEYAVQVAQAKANLDKARVGYQQAKDSFDRVKGLYDSNAVSQSDYEGARDRLTIAERDLSLAQQAYSLVTQGESGSSNNKAILKSPISGTIINKLATTGQLVSAGTPVYKIGQISKLKIILPVPDYEISQWQVGNSVKISLYNKSRDGRVVRIFPSTNQGTGTIGVEVNIENSAHDWFPGQVVSVSRILAERQGIFLPVEAVINRGEKDPYVFVVDNHKATKRTVTIGNLFDNNRLEITSGLKSGEIIVTRGADLLFDGDAVKAVGGNGQ